MRPEYDIFGLAEHGGTFRGNTHALVTARVASGKFWTDDTFQIQIARKTEILEQLLNTLAGMVPGVDVGSGELAGVICSRAFHKGLVIETSGSEDQVVKGLAPLTTPEEMFRKGLNILLDAARDVTETTKFAAE